MPGNKIKRGVKMENVTKLYSILDRTAEMLGPIFEAVNDGVAVRNYSNVIAKTQQEYRNDYALCRLGEFNSKTGEIIPEFPPKMVDIPYKKEL